MKFCSIKQKLLSLQCNTVWRRTLISDGARIGNCLKPIVYKYLIRKRINRRYKPLRGHPSRSVHFGFFHPPPRNKTTLQGTHKMWGRTPRQKLRDKKPIENRPSDRSRESREAHPQKKRRCPLPNGHKKRVSYLHRAATTHYRCFDQDLAEFVRSMP